MNSPKFKTNIQLCLRNTNALSGTPKILKRQAQLLQKHAQVSIVSESFYPDLKLNKNIQCLKTWKWPSHSLFQRQFYDWQAKQWAKLKKPDLIIGHGDTLVQDILFMHTCVHKAQEIEGGPSKKNTSVPFHRMILEGGNFKVLICNSKMMKDDLTSRFQIKVPTHVIYPGHELDLKNQIDQSKVLELRNQLAHHQDKIIIGLVTSGNLENRGALTLLKAVALLPEKLKEKISLLIVGKESRPEKYFNLANELGIQGLLHLIDPRPDVQNIISAVDIIVHVARMEAFGMSVVESMSLSRPIIASQTVGCAELFTSDQRDFIVNGQNPQILSQRLEILINDENLRQRLGEENKIQSEGYSWEEYDRKCFEVIDQYLPK